MDKLIKSFREDRSIVNAAKLAKHNRKHPMASCMLMPEDAAELNAALAMVNAS